MLLSVIVPVFNERRTIERVIDVIRSVPVQKEILIVDDGSKDGTRDYLAQRKHDPGIRIFFHDRNLGKGRAIRTALDQARGNVILIQDADMEYDPNEYPKLLLPFEDPKISVVYGTRFSNVNKYLFIWHWFCNRFLGGRYEIRYLHHFLGIQALNFLANILYSANITDEATCYKVFRREVLDKVKLKCLGFEFCPEFTAKVRKAGYRIFEVPITYHPRSRKEGKKLNWKHGFEAIFTLFRYRFVD